MKNLKSDILIKDQKLAKYEERIAEYECSTKTYETELQFLREKLESTTTKLERSNGSTSGNETPRGTNNNYSSSSMASLLSIPDEVFDRSIWQYESGTDLVHQNSFNMGSHHHAYGNMEATQNLEPLFAEEEHHSKKRKFNL